MARSTLVARKAELVAVLAPAGVPAVAGVTAVYDHEPANSDALPPVFITVATTAMTPDFWRFAVRLYVGLGADAAQAQRDIDTIMPAVDAVIGTDSTVGPSDWTIEFLLDIRTPMICATNNLSCGREDYY